MIRKTLLGAAMALAMATPASAAGMTVADFEKLDANPQYQGMVMSYLAGSVEGILIGAAAEAKAETGHSGRMKALCPDMEDHYLPKDTLADVRAILKAHPEIPRETTTMGAVVAMAVGKRYACQ